MTWDEWAAIDAAQQAADAQAEARQAERVASKEVRQLAAEGREHIQALSGTAPPPPSPPGTPVPPRSVLDGLRLHLAKMRAALDTRRDEP